jgi:hypothetical protein
VPAWGSALHATHHRRTQTHVLALCHDIARLGRPMNPIATSDPVVPRALSEINEEADPLTRLNGGPHVDPLGPSRRTRLDA